MTIRNWTLALLGATALTAVHGAAMAQEATATTAEEMASQVEFLQAQVEAMQAQLDELKKKSAAATPGWKGAPEFKGDGFTFKLRGRLQYDFGYLGRPEGVSNEGLGFSNELRRGRLGVEGQIAGPFAYKFEVDFAGNEVEVADAFFQWKGGDTSVSVGHHNNFQSLEELTSSRFSSFLERAAFTDAFGFERRIGVSAGFQQGDFRIDAGVFTDDISSAGDGNNSYSLDARAVYAPKMGDAQLHFGGSAHYRDLQDTAGELRYRQRPQIHSTSVRFVGTPNLDVGKETSYGLEAAGIFGPLHVAGEAHWLKASLLTPAASDPTFFGGYAEVGYFLTGESRGYKSGVFDRTKVLNPIDKGGWGALQAVARVDYLDLSDAGIVGGKQTAYQLGLTWIPVDHVRFLANYSHLQFDNAAIPAAGGDRDYGVDVFGVRAQLDF